MKLGFEIRENGLSGELQEGIDNSLEVVKSSKKLQNTHYDVAPLPLNLLFQRTVNTSKNFTIKGSQTFSVQCFTQ